MIKQIGDLEMAILSVHEEEWAVITNITINELEQGQYKFQVTAKIIEKREFFHTKIRKVYTDILLIEKKETDDFRPEKTYMLIQALLLSELQEILTIQAKECYLIDDKIRI